MLTSAWTIPSPTAPHRGYGDRTRAAYLADLRDFHAWCARIGIGLLAAHRGHIEAYIHALEQADRSRATVARRLATLTGFYRYAVQEGALPHSPAAHIRRPPRWREDFRAVTRRRSRSGGAAGPWPGSRWADRGWPPSCRRTRGCRCGRGRRA